MTSPSGCCGPVILDDTLRRHARPTDIKINVAGEEDHDPTHISVTAALKNLAFVKQVGSVFTTNNWATSSAAFGGFTNMLKSGNEVWTITAPVGTVKRVDFAIFYRVVGRNFGTIMSGATIRCSMILMIHQKVHL